MDRNRIFCRANIGTGWLLLVCSPALWAVNIPITIVGSTETQIEISYAPTSSGPCTITATDNNNGPVVADLDASKFANAATDVLRTRVNGFLWPTLTNGPRRTVFIGGHDEIKQGLDGKWYSTALQVASPHTITVTCNGGADSGTVTVPTANLPAGSYYPEMPIPTPGSPLAGMAQPFIDYSLANPIVNDPVTGVLIQAVSKPTDVLMGGSDASNTALWAPDVIDVNGGAWTNPNNFITNRTSSTLATTSTPNAPLFAAFAANWPTNSGGVHSNYTDVTVAPYGSASSNTIVSEWCLSQDSGQTCANYTPLDVTYTTAAQCQPANNCAQTIPAALPSAAFSGWGGMKGAFGIYDLLNGTVSGVSTSGHLVTAPIAYPALGFNLERVHGSKFKLTTCATGAGGIFTVDHTDAEGQITMIESASNTGCTYTDMAVGIRVILKNGGTLNVSLTGASWNALPTSSGSNGEKWICARSKVNDIQTDCDGNTRSPAISGYLCGLNTAIYLIQDDGRMCSQSELYSLNTSPQYHLTSDQNGQIAPIDSRTFVLTALGQTSIIGHIVKMTHIANNYQALPVDPAHTQNDRFTYTDLTATTTAIGTQIASAGGTVATALATGLWNPMGLDGVIENGSGGATLQYRTDSGGDTQCMLAWADAATNTLLSTNAMYGGYPFSYSACHFGAQGGSGYSTVSVQSESSQLSPIFFNSGVLLGGPFQSRVTAISKNGSFVQWTLPAISAASNASPAVLTSTASDIDEVNAVNASQGALITCSGGTGSWAALNANLYAHFLSANTFSLYTDPKGVTPLDSTSFGTFAGQTITCKTGPPAYNIAIASVANNSGAARFTADTSGYFGPFYPSGTLSMMTDADPVAVNSGNQMTSKTQYYVKVSGAGAGKFDLYTDSALTTPVTYATASGWAGNAVTLAQICPDPATITLPGPLYMDTGFGTTGASNQKNRCLKIRLNGEFCSDYPKAGEATGYPCPGTGVHTTQSMMHQINVGDGIMSLRSFGNQHEIMYVLAVDRSAGENQVDVTVLRGYGDDSKYGWRGVNSLIDRYNMQHSAGWTGWAASVIIGGLINTNASPNTYAVPPVNGSHFDFVPGTTSGNVSQVSAYAPNSAPDSKINVSISTYAGPSTTLHSSMPLFSSSPSYSLTTLQQSYPSMRWRGDQAPASEQVWNADWMAMNGGFGYSQNNGDGTGLTSIPTGGVWNGSFGNIRGTTYDAGNATTQVYKIPVQSAVNEKITPLVVTAAPHGIFVDKSGPGSLIVDADAGKRCTAYVAGECRPNSIVGDTFISGRGWYTAYGQCIANTSTLGSPCAFGLWPGAGWAVQVRNTPIDTTNRGVRRLTLGFWTPPNHYSFSNWVATPDAKWGIFVPNPVQGRSGLQQWFAMKLPPWPTLADPTDRTTFVPVVKRYPAAPGDNIRIAFGYAENGDPANLYCTTRQETCWTSAAATASNPFAFASEAQQKAACGSGCTVTIPAIAGRILFYQVEHTSGSGTLLGPLQAVALP